MSRLHAGAMSIDAQPTAVDEVVARALDDLGEDGRRIADRRRRGRSPGPGRPRTAGAGAGEPRHQRAALLAGRRSPPHLTGSRLGDRVEIRVIDRGPGIPPDDWDRVFLPFQRLGDTDNTTGVGLGLALSRGLTEAMGGTLEPEETPGGGLTMVVSLPAVTDMATPTPGRARARRGEPDDPRPRRR